MFKNRQFDFLSSARLTASWSLILCLGAFVWILVKGFNYGIDFSGGHEIQVRFQRPPSVEDIRSYAIQKGFTAASVQSFGSENEFLIFAGGKEKNKALSGSGFRAVEALVESLKVDFADQGVEIRRMDSVGPQIGAELRRKGLLAVIYSLIMILIYVGLRFDYKFAPPAVICLFHDAVWTMWIFIVFNLTVNVQTLAALLAIIGYSLNDTIVTFDRIRENKEFFGQKKSFASICNRSINDVLSRTILTSITTLLAVGVMWFYTSGVIKDFAFTLGVGVVIGTYSSIYVATPLVVFMQYLQNRRHRSRAL